LQFGLAPVFGLSRNAIGEALKEGGRSLTAGARISRDRDTLVIAKVTLALVLVIGAGLLLRSLYSLRHVDPGFRPENVLTFSLSLPDGTKGIERFYDQLNQKLERIPGVKEAAASSALPIANLGGWGKYFTIEEHPASRLADVPLIQYREVTPHYLRDLQIPLLEGRFFAQDEDSSKPLVAVINESARRRFFPNENPVGKLIHLARPSPPFQISFQHPITACLALPSLASSAMSTMPALDSSPNRSYSSRICKARRRATRMLHHTRICSLEPH
jgi:putative ABC transport system permease protein